MDLLTKSIESAGKPDLVLSSYSMVFSLQNCSDQLWEKSVLLIEKT